MFSVCLVVITVDLFLVFPETSNVTEVEPFAYIDGIEMAPLKYDIPIQSLPEVIDDCFEVRTVQYVPCK